MVAFTITPSRAAARLNSGVRPVQKHMPVNKRETWLGAVDPRLSKPLFFATNSVPARAPALRFWVQHVAKSGLRLCARGRSVYWSKATAGTRLNIRSSRARFAASALAGYDLTIANAAQRPGLAQALGTRLNLMDGD